MPARSLSTGSLIRLTVVAAVVMAANLSFGADDDGRKGEERVEYRLVYEEIGGGADSAVSPDGKFFSFSSRRSGNLDVWTVEIETGKLRQITSNPASDNEARWHPDGTRLVFVSLRNGSQDVYTIDLETGEEKIIADEPNNEDYPTFSKDGAEIVFTGGPRGYREVKVYNFATGKIRTLTRRYGFVGATNFSHDGKWIVFHAYYDNSYSSGRSDVYIVSSQGGEVKNITSAPDVWDYKPNWSHNGEWIAISSKRATPNFNIFIMHPDGSELRAITNEIGPVPMRGGRVSMSNANGADLRWANWTKDGRLGWHRINPQKGQLRSVEVSTGKITEIVASEYPINDLSLSPDGSSLLYENEARVYVLDARAGAEPRALGSGLQPRWSKNGESILVRRNRPARIELIPAGGGEATVISETVADWPPPRVDSWSPDGKSLALITDHDAGPELTVVSPGGSKQTLTRDGAPKSSPAWSADGTTIFYTENHAASVGYYLTVHPVY